jgi:DNA (cytosine-5)-methyltransferase 1
MLRVISEIKPTWVLGENVAGIINMALDQVLSDLEDLGYETQAFIIPACGVDAPHRRNRCFILAHTIGNGRRGRSDGDAPGCNRALQVERSGAGEKHGLLADTDNTKTARQREYGREVHAESEPSGLGVGCGEGWWTVEPDVGRVASRIPSRVDRLKCLGNAVVPQQVYPILKAIAELEVTP